MRLGPGPGTLSNYHSRETSPTISSIRQVTSRRRCWRKYNTWARSTEMGKKPGCFFRTVQNSRLLRTRTTDASGGRRARWGVLEWTEISIGAFLQLKDTLCFSCICFWSLSSSLVQCTYQYHFNVRTPPSKASLSRAIVTNLEIQEILPSWCSGQYGGTTGFRISAM